MLTRVVLREGARSIVATSVAWLALAVPTVNAQSQALPPAPRPIDAASSNAPLAAADEKSIDAFLATLDLGRAVPAGAPTTRLADARSTLPAADARAVAAKPAARGEFRPLLDEKPSPLQTALLLLAGAGVIGLAGAGLALTMKAFRDDLRRRKRGHRRRFQRTPDEASHASPR